MNIYIRSYRYRITKMLLSIFIVIGLLYLHNLIFHESIISISNQLSAYENADFSIAYKLNYCVESENQFVYPDLDIQFFSEKDKNCRLTVSSLMINEGTKYTLQEFVAIRKLGNDEIALTEMVANKYGLSVGGSLFLSFPYSSELIEKQIVMILPTNYDICNPKIGNDVGMVFIGYDSKYISNVKSYYMVFARESLVDKLSRYPQVIAGVVNKSENYEMVMEQGVFVLVFEFAIVVCGLIAVHAILLKRSDLLLRRYCIKGVKRKNAWRVSCIEKIFFTVLPCMGGMYLISLKLQMNNMFSMTYCIIPPVLAVLYCFFCKCRKTI